VARVFESLAAVVRTVLVREQLPESERPPPARWPSLLKHLVAVERLPFEAPPVASRSDPRPSLARMVLAREHLPSEPRPVGASRSRWLAWLFTPERIDGA